MKVYGVVKDADAEKPLADAKVSLYVGEKELAVLYSDIKGRFEHKETAQYLDKTLICRVEKEAFQQREISYMIEGEEVPLEVELIPKNPKKPIKKKEMPKWLIFAGIGGVALIILLIFIISLSKPSDSSSVAGDWDSAIGQATLKQTGNQVTGLLTYSHGPAKGHTASMKGTLQGKQITYTWWLTLDPNGEQNPQGSGTFNLSNDGKTLSGPFNDRNFPGQTSILEMTR